MITSDPECSNWEPCYCPHCKSEGYLEQTESCKYYKKPEPEPIDPLGNYRHVGHTLNVKIHRNT